MNEHVRLLEANLAPFFTENDFHRLDDPADTWIRRWRGLVQELTLTLTKGGHLRVTGVVGKEGSQDGLGDRLGAASFGNPSIGSEGFWKIDTKNEVRETTEKVRAALRQVMFPVLDSIAGPTPLLALMQADPNSIYRLDSIAVDDVTSVPEATRPLVSDSLALQTADQLRNWIVLPLENRLRKFGFKLQADGKSLTRVRDDVTDVLLLDIANWGAHFGINAFSWVKPLGLGISDEYSLDYAFTLNGGMLSPTYPEDLGGMAYPLGNKELANSALQKVEHDILERALPALERVTDLESYVGSVHPSFRKSLHRFPGLPA